MQFLVLKLEDEFHRELVRRLHAIAIFNGKTVEEQVMHYLEKAPIDRDMLKALTHIQNWAEGGDWTGFV